MEKWEKCFLCAAENSKASAYMLMCFFVPEADRVSFQTKSGRLIVEKKGIYMK